MGEKIQVLIDSVKTEFELLLNIIDDHQGFLLVVLTVIGWLAVFWLGLRQQRKLLQDQAKMEVYKELSILKQSLDNIFSIDLAVFAEHTATFVFIEMDGAEKNIYTNPRFSKPYEYWLDYTSKLGEKISRFSEEYLKFMIRVETWISIMPELKSSKGILFNELNILNNKLWEHQRYLQSLDTTKWRTWKEDVIKKANEIGDEITVNVGYLDDFMGLIHNELLSSIFGHPIEARNLSHLNKEVVYKALTKNGIVEKTHIPSKRK